MGFRDWDEVNYTNISANMKGNIYYRQWLQVKTQYFWLTIVFLVENLLLLFPALHTSLTILHLHSILPSLPEEDPTLTLSYLLLPSPPPLPFLPAVLPVHTVQPEGSHLVPPPHHL